MERLVPLLAQPRDHGPDKGRRRRVDDGRRDDLDHVLRVLLDRQPLLLRTRVEGRNGSAVDIARDERDPDVVLERDPLELLDQPVSLRLVVAGRPVV